MTEFKHTPDSLADQLDQTLPAGRVSNPVSNTDPLVDAALYVASAPKPGLSAEAKARIQSQMLQHARQQPAPLRPNFAPILRWALIACVVLIIMLIPTAQVTLASVPGEPLYPVKMTIEQIETSLANSPALRASVSLTHAERRTQEAQTLLSRGQFDPALISSAYTDMANAAAIIRTNAEFDPGLRLKIQSQSAALVAAIDSLLISATQPDQPLAATVTPLVDDILATQNSGALLLPATVTSTPMPTVTALPSAAITPTSVSLPTQTDIPAVEASATPVPTSPPIVEPTEVQAVNLVVTGPIEAINGNIIVIYGIEITFDPNDPLLLTLQIGDNISISGVIGEGNLVVTVIDVQPADDSIAINPDEQNVWRDSGDCSNPPPPWAPANGWRRRCEGQSGGSQNNRGNQGQGQGQGQNQGQGQGQGRGQGRGNSGDNSDDDD